MLSNIVKEHSKWHLTHAMSGVERLELENNRLNGTVCSKFCKLADRRRTELGLKGFSFVTDCYEEIECECCTECCEDSRYGETLAICDWNGEILQFEDERALPEPKCCPLTQVVFPIS